MLSSQAPPRRPPRIPSAGCLQQEAACPLGQMLPVFFEEPDAGAPSDGASEEPPLLWLWPGRALTAAAAARMVKMVLNCILIDGLVCLVVEWELVS